MLGIYLNVQFIQDSVLFRVRFSQLVSLSKYSYGDRCGRHPGHDRMVVGFTPITTKVVSLNPVHGEVYSLQHYVIKFVCDMRQVCGFL